MSALDFFQINTEFLKSSVFREMLLHIEDMWLIKEFQDFVESETTFKISEVPMLIQTVLDSAFTDNIQNIKVHEFQAIGFEAIQILVTNDILLSIRFRNNRLDSCSLCCHTEKFCLDIHLYDSDMDYWIIQMFVPTEIIKDTLVGVFVQCTDWTALSRGDVEIYTIQKKLKELQLNCKQWVDSTSFFQTSLVGHYNIHTTDGNIIQVSSKPYVSDNSGRNFYNNTIYQPHFTNREMYIAKEMYNTIIHLDELKQLNKYAFEMANKYFLQKN